MTFADSILTSNAIDQSSSQPAATTSTPFKFKSSLLPTDMSTPPPNANPFADISTPLTDLSKEKITFSAGSTKPLPQLQKSTLQNHDHDIKTLINDSLLEVKDFNSPEFSFGPQEMKENSAAKRVRNEVK